VQGSCPSECVKDCLPRWGYTHKYCNSTVALSHPHAQSGLGRYQPTARNPPKVPQSAGSMGDAVAAERSRSSHLHRHGCCDRRVPRVLWTNPAARPKKWADASLVQSPPMLPGLKHSSFFPDFLHHDVQLANTYMTRRSGKTSKCHD